MQQFTPELLLSQFLRGQKISSDLFGKLIRQVSRTLGITQDRLEELARKEYGEIMKDGYIFPDEQLGSMDQTVISRVSRNQQDPTPAQVYTWINAILKSQELRAYCEKYQQDHPDFVRELETALWNSSGHQSPQAIADNYNDAARFMQTFAQEPKARLRRDKNSDDVITDYEIPVAGEQNTDAVSLKIQEPHA
jgi:hypothetical protein